MRLGVQGVLVVLALLCFGLVSAQIPSGDPSPFIEADIDIDAEASVAGVGNTAIRGSIKINTDGVGNIIDVVIGALCRIFPCKGDDKQAQILLRTSQPDIGDGRTGIVLGGGAVGIGDFFAGIVTEDSVYEWGFSIRFAADAPVRIRSMTFHKDAVLTEDYKQALGIEGAYFVPAGTYFVLDNKLTIPVNQQR